MTKKNMNISAPPNKYGITYRFSAQRGGTVRFFKLPPRKKQRDAIERLLNAYGFKGCDDLYYDVLCPSRGEALQWYLDNLVAYVDLTLRTTVTPTARSYRVEYFVAYGKDIFSSAFDITAAFVKAHKRWTTRGRVVQGKKLTTALDAVLTNLK